MENSTEAAHGAFAMQSFLSTTRQGLASDRRVRHLAKKANPRRAIESRAAGVGD